MEDELAIGYMYIFPIFMLAFTFVCASASWYDVRACVCPRIVHDPFFPALSLISLSFPRPKPCIPVIPAGLNRMTKNGTNTVCLRTACCIFGRPVCANQCTLWRIYTLMAIYTSPPWLLSKEFHLLIGGSNTPRENRRRRNSFACRVVKYWNRLPLAVASVTDKLAFKRQLDTYIYP